MVILCTIDLETREVSLPAGQVIASYDHNVDVIRFQAEAIPGFSLNTSSIKIAAQGPNKARHDYAVDPSTVQIEEETGYITFDWPIPQGVTEMPGDMFGYGATGQLIFAVCAEIIDGSTVSKAWHSDDGIITVVAHLEPEAGGGEDPEEEATNAQKIAQLQTDVAVINTQVGALANGTPTPVATVAEMTDESAVYLYTGSETGYTAGNWYYYDGTAWTSGGTYGGAVTSKTFTQHDVPADDFAVGQALADKADVDDVENIKLDLDSRTLINKKTLTSFPIKGGAFTNLHPDSAVKPYYLGGLNSNYVEFECTINAGQSDFWVGMQVDSDTSMKFIGINMRNADGNKLRRVENNTSSTTILNSTTPRTLLPVGTSHVTAEIDANTFRIYCNGVMYSQFEIAESYTIKGLAFLNFGLADGNISNLSVYDTLERISDAIITNDYVNVTDAVISENSWASFKDFPTNKIYGVNVPTANYASLGFPISRAGTFMCIRPWDLASTVYNYRTYIYVCNDAYEFTRAFICFGHGTTVTPWVSIDTYGGAGYKNPLAEAMMDNNNKVCFIGDSIIAGLGGTGYDVSESGGGEYIMYRGFDRYTNIHGYCWVNEMIQHMNDVYGHTNVKNRGVGGISTKEILDNWTTLLDGANTVVLSCGTNDYNNLERITSYLPQIAKECIKAGVKLMVMTNTPNNTADANKYNAVKGRIVAVCNTLGIPVYDMYSEFEMYLSLKGLTLADVLNSDGIHPNDTGYAIMFEIAKKLFQI